MSDELLVDRIYEAAIVPDAWTPVLDELVRISDGALASVIAVKDGDMAWIGTPDANKLIADFMALQKPDFNSRIRKLDTSAVGFFNDADMFSPEQMKRDSFYTEFLYPRGYGWCLGTSSFTPTGEMLSVSVERRFARGAFDQADVDRLNTFAPHLTRSALLGARLGLDRAREMAEALQIIGLPAAVLRGNGRPLAMNAMFEKLMPHVVADRTERLVVAHEGADALIESAISKNARSHLNMPLSIPVPATPTQPPMIFHVIPVARSARDIFAMASTLLVVTPVVRSSVPNAQVIQGLFDLTPAEARVAKAVAEGIAVDAIAERLSVSRETVRTHLKSVLSKTGVARQADLVSLLTVQVQT